MTCHYPDLGSASDWLKQILTRNTTQICQIWAMTSIECLRSFFKHHFTGQPVLASRKVGCFLTLWLGFYACSLYAFPFLIGLPMECLGGLCWLAKVGSWQLWRGTWRYSKGSKTITRSHPLRGEEASVHNQALTQAFLYLQWHPARVKLPYLFD